MVCAEPQRQVPFWRPQQLKPRLKLAVEDEAVLRAAGWGQQGPGSWDPAFLAAEEDKLILEARRLGLQWHEIAQRLPDRTVSSLRKQFGTSRPRPKVCPASLMMHTETGAHARPRSQGQPCHHTLTFPHACVHCEPSTG